MAENALHGVNLTGWLTLEPWVTPELFSGSGALDEPSLVTSLGAKGYREVVRRHRARFLTKDDFSRIASRGFNAVRLPVPWYVFGEAGPNPGPYLGCIDEVDQVLEWAEEIDLKVVFALAVNPGVPGDEEAWNNFTDDRGIRENALWVLSQLSSRYASRMGFYGIEVADDARIQTRRGLGVTDGMPGHLLRNYYRAAYDRVREAAGTDPVVIIPDAGMPTDWRRFMAQRRYQNVWLDCHLDKPSAIMADMGYAPGASTLGVRHIMAVIPRHIREDQRSGLPVMVGKWSSALPIADAAMTPEGRVALERIYSSEQLTAYEKLPAWFFQTWKTTGRLSSWDARVALSSFERGLICS